MLPTRQRGFVDTSTCISNEIGVRQGIPYPYNWVRELYGIEDTGVYARVERLVDTPQCQAYPVPGVVLLGWYHGPSNGHDTV